jgi:hypothetical protein
MAKDYYIWGRIRSWGEGLELLGWLGVGMGVAECAEEID